MKQRITLLQFLMAWLLLLAAAPQKAVASTELSKSSTFHQSETIATTVGDFGYFFYWTYDFGGEELQNVCTMAVYAGESEDAVIPSTVTYDGVTFTVIGIDYRFHDAANYGKCKKLTIPNTVVYIQTGAFKGIHQITHLTFADGDGTTYCAGGDYGAFTYMNGLQEVYVGRELSWNYEEYVQAPFYRNNEGSYFKVTVGPQVKTLHYHTFHHAHVNAVEILDAEQTLRIEEDVFSDCPKIAKWTQLRQIDCPDQYVKGSGELKEITIGGHVTSIRDKEFMNCYNVYSITLGGSLETIGEYAFEDCDDVKELTIPASVTKIGYEAFYDMDDLEKLTFADNLKDPLDMTGGFVFYGYDGYSKSLKEVYLGRSLRTKEGNENYEFADRSKITKVTVGPGCSSIPDKLFMNCYKMETIDFSNAGNLTSIGKQAFEDCDEVTELTIPKSVLSIGYEAFYDMDELVKLTFEDGDAKLDMTGGFVFYGYDGYSKELQEVYLGRTLLTKKGNENYEFADRSNITKVTIGPGCTAIPDKLFMNCYDMRTIDMSKATALKTIGQHAFEDCDDVTSLVIPASVTKIGYEAFYDIDDLVELTFEDGTDNLDLWEGAQFRAYDNANGNLRTVYLGREVTIDVGGYQKDNFYNRGITNVTIGKYVKNVPAMMFYNNPFASITFNAGAGPIYIGDKAFVGDGNTSVTSIIIPTPVEHIGTRAFYDNSSLITLSLKMTKGARIMEDAFEDCDLLTTVIVELAGNMSTLQEQGDDDQCFEDGVYENATLRYTAASATFVNDNAPWNKFKHMDDGYTGNLTFIYDGTTIGLKQQSDGTFRYENNSGDLQTLYLKDNLPISAPVDFVANVNYDREIGTDTWGTTLYIPFTVPKPEGWTLYTFPKAQTSTVGKITLTEVTTGIIEAFTPYIVTIDPEQGNTIPVQMATVKSGHKEISITSGDYKLTGTINGLTDPGVNYIPTTTPMQFVPTTDAVAPYRAKLEYTGNGTIEHALEGVVGLWKGNGTQTDPYIVSNAEEWENIHELLMESADGKVFEGVYFKQTENIETTKSIGLTGESHGKYFAGNYNGAGHTLTCNITSTGKAAAAFYQVNSATIENLHVAGTISGGIHSAGLVAIVKGTATPDDPNGPVTSIRNCRVSADITCLGDNLNGAHGGGFVGHKHDSYVYMDNCLFDGKLTATPGDHSDICLGAFVGWGDDTKIRIYNSVEHGTYVNATPEQTGFCWAFINSNPTNNLSEKSVNDCVAITSTLPDCRGVNKYYLLISGTDGLTVTPAEAAASTYALGGYSVTENGNYLFGDELYTYGTKTVTFKVGCSNDWKVTNVYVNQVNAATATDEQDVYTCTVPSDITASPYVTSTFAFVWEGSGTTDDPWIIDSEEDFYRMKIYRESNLAQFTMVGRNFKVLAGTYDLEENVQVDSRMTIYGQVNLNNQSGKTMTAKKGFELSQGNTLTLGGLGTLVIDDCVDGKSGIGAVEVGTLVINSGNVNVKGGMYAAALGGDKNNTNGGAITINGGVVNAAGGPGAAAIGGGYSDQAGNYGVCGDIAINGGQVTATVATSNDGEKAIGYGYHYLVSGGENLGKLTLSWTNEDDFVSATYSVNSITLEKEFLLDGTKTRATLANIDGQKIVPHLNALTLADNEDNSEAIGEYNGKKCYVILDGRTLYKDGKWNTICLPFNLTNLNGTPLEGAEVRTLGNESNYTESDGTLTLSFSEKRTTIAAGVPYIIKWEQGENIESPMFTDVTVSSQTEPVNTHYVNFIGNFSPVLFEANNRSVLYLGADNKLYWPNAAVTLNACRAYFQLNGLTISEHAGGVRAFVLDFGDGEETSISEELRVKSEASASAWYDLQGRRLSGKPTTPGLYINNGIKVAVK